MQSREEAQSVAGCDSDTDQSTNQSISQVKFFFKELKNGTGWYWMDMGPLASWICCALICFALLVVLKAQSPSTVQFGQVVSEAGGTLDWLHPEVLAQLGLRVLR